MFGYVAADPLKLNKEQKERYRSIYCGLCDTLGKEHGLLDRFALTYDLTFLILVLTDVSGAEYRKKQAICPFHLRKTDLLISPFSLYASDMSILLAYYKTVDDVKDDRSPFAYAARCMLKKEANDIVRNYKDQSSVIIECLQKLENAEKSFDCDPDRLAGIFGRLLGSIFSLSGAGDEEMLYAFGEALGKTIYIMDASADLREDLKKKRFNPLVMTDGKTIELILEDLMADVLIKYRLLPHGKDRAIIENILLSGIWSIYLGKKSERNKSVGKRSL